MHRFILIIILLTSMSCQSAVNLDDMNYNSINSAAFKLNSVDVTELTGQGLIDQPQLSSFVLPLLLGLTLLTTISNSDGTYSNSTYNLMSGEKTDLGSEWIE